MVRLNKNSLISDIIINSIDKPNDTKTSSNLSKNSLNSVDNSNNLKINPNLSKKKKISAQSIIDTCRIPLNPSKKKNSQFIINKIKTPAEYLRNTSGIPPEYLQKRKKTAFLTKIKRCHYRVKKKSVVFPSDNGWYTICVYHPYNHTIIQSYNRKRFLVYQALPLDKTTYNKSFTTPKCDTYLILPSHKSFFTFVSIYSSLLNFLFVSLETKNPVAFWSNKNKNIKMELKK